MDTETILIVDDNKEIVYSIGELLKYGAVQIALVSEILPQLQMAPVI